MTNKSMIHSYSNRRSRILLLFAILILCVITIVLTGRSLVKDVFAAAPANIRIAHLAPFSDENTDVDIYINEILIAPGKSFNASTQYFESPTSELLVRVAISGTQNFVISETVTLADDTDYTLLITGDGERQPLDVIQIEDDNTAPADGNFKLKLGHVAPFATDLNETLVDIRLEDGTLLLADVAYGDVNAFVELPVGVYDINVTTPGGETTLIDIVPVEYDPGEIISLFAYGDGINQPLGAFVYPDVSFGFPLSLEGVVPPPGDPRLYVAHLAPFADEAGTSVTVRLNEADSQTEFVYGDSTGYLTVPAGEYLVEVLPTGTETVAISATVNLTDGVDYTALAIGDGENQSLAIQALIDDNSNPGDNRAWLRLGHLAPFDDTLVGTTADVRLQDGTPLLENVQFGAVADPINLPAGEYNLKITSPGGDVTLIDPAPISLGDGDIVSAFAVGDGINQSFEVFAIINGEEGVFLPLEEPPTARLYVAHLAPFAADDDTSVTIRLNGTDTLTETVYGDSTGYLTVPAGGYLVEVLPTGTETVAISTTVNLADGLDYTAVAIGDGTNLDLSIQAAVDDNSEPADGNFALRLGHLAPFADSVPQTLADVRLQDGTPVAEGILFGSIATRVELPAGEYDLKITNPGGAVTLIDPQPATFAEGDIVSAFATGDGTNQELGVFAITNGEPGAFLPLEGEEPGPEPEGARLYVAHLAPFAAGDDTSVTVRLNGTDTLTETVYGDSTGYLTVPAGDYLIEILPTGGDTVAMSAEAMLVDGVDYTALAIGDGANQDLEIKALGDDNNTPADGTFALRLGHLAPFAATAEATMADIRLQDGTLVLGDVVFGSVAARVELPAGEYDLKITTPGGETTLIDPQPTTFAEGDIVSAFAVGDGSNQDLGVFTIINGAEGVFLPLEGDDHTGPRLYVAHLAPFASGDGTSVTVRLNGADVLTDFNYGGSTGYLNLEANDYLVEILPTGSETVAISATVTLTDGVDYTALAVGDSDKQALSIIPLVDDNSAPADGNFALRLGHLAPFASTPETTLADVRLQDGTLVLGNVSFGGVADRIELPAGEYDLKITTPGGEVTLIDPAPVTFAAGDVVSAFAVGEGVNQDLSVFAIINGGQGVFLPDATLGGTTQIFLPVIRR